MSKTPSPELRQEAFLQETDMPARVPGAPPGTKKRNALRVLTFVVILGGIAGFCAWYLSRDFENTDDAFIDGHIIQVSPRVSAQVLAVHIDDNLEVKRGQLLVELDPQDFRVALEKAQAQLAQAQAQVLQAQA